MFFKMKVRDKHYHGDVRDGCVTVLKAIEEVEGDPEHHYKNYLCIVHNEECCRCGWGWGYHSHDKYTEI